MRYLTIAIVLGFTLPVWADSAPEDYLDKGNLKAALEVSDLQGGFAGFNGNIWRVQTDGSITAVKTVVRKEEVMYQGKLSKQQVEALAKDLAKYDLANLKSEGKPMANPHAVTIKWGKDSRTLNLTAGAALPKADAKSVEGRYAGIVEAVRALGQKGKEKEK